MPRPDFAVLTGDAPVPDRLAGGVVAVGNFDGVHRGHQAVVAMARAAARGEGLPAMALTFEPHPRSFFRPDEPVFRLTPAPVKAELLAALGLDGVVEMTFDAALAGLSAGEFVDQVLCARLGARHVVVGHDFHFGRGREGSPMALEALGAERGFATTIVPPARGRSGALHASSTVRERLEEGDVEGAAAILGYRWFVRGEIVHGDKRGRTLGYPTANMRLSPDCRLAHGVYAVRVGLDGAIHGGVASYGRRPQFDNGPPLLETFLFGFDGDLYGRTLDVELCRRIRPELRFESVDALVSRMAEDAALARAHVAALSGPIPAFLADEPR